jgi:glutamine synthetase
MTEQMRAQLVRDFLLDELRQLIATGEIDNVILAPTDMQGRLQGKRLSAEFFPTR